MIITKGKKLEEVLTQRQALSKWETGVPNPQNKAGYEPPTQPDVVGEAGQLNIPSSSSLRRLYWTVKLKPDVFGW